MVHARSFSRRFIFASTAAFVALILSITGCAKDNKTPIANENIAVTPLDTCATGATYRGGAWSKTTYAQMNAVPYGHGMRDFRHDRYYANQGFCGCPGGTQPMCDGGIGVVCIPGAILVNHTDIAWYQHGPSGMRFSGYGGYTAYTGAIEPYQPQRNYPRSRGPINRQPVIQVVPQHCAIQIGQTCTIGVNSCGPNSYCRPLSQDHRETVGVCKR